MKENEANFDICSFGKRNLPVLKENKQPSKQRPAGITHRDLLLG